MQSAPATPMARKKPPALILKVRTEFILASPLKTEHEINVIKLDCFASGVGLKPFVLGAASGRKSSFVESTAQKTNGYLKRDLALRRIWPEFAPQN